MKKLFYCCLCAVLILALLCPAGALAAGSAAEPEQEAPAQEAPAEDAAEVPDRPAESPIEGVYGLFGLPTFEEWAEEGVENIEYYVEWLVEACYVYYFYYLDDEEFPEEPLWVLLDYTVDSLDEFLEKYEIEMDVYIELEQHWEDMIETFRKEREWQQEYYERRKAEMLERLGGIPGIVNVMVNGEFVKFAETAVPERKDGHTYTPAKLFFEALGAEVKFDNRARVITAEFEDYSAVIAIGSDRMFISGDGDRREVDLGAESYISPGGSSYVPVRAVAEAFGLDVYWDSFYETVVIIDTAGLMADIDKDFTKLNKLLKMSLNTAADPVGILKSVLSVIVSVKLFDSLDGDTDAKLGADLTMVSDGQNFNMTVNIKLDGLVGLILAEYPYSQAEIDEIMESEEMKTLELFFDTKAEIIYNYDEDTLYIKAPFLTPLIPELPAGAWISVGDASRELALLFYPPDLYYIMGEPEADDPDDPEADDEFVSDPSVGALIVSDNSYYQTRNQIFLYSYIKGDADDLRSLLGDDKIKVNGNDYSLKLTLDDILGEEDEDDDLYYYYYYRYVQSAFDLEVDIKTDGEAITRVSGKYFMRESYYYYSGVTQTKCEFDISAEHISISYEVHEKNSYVVGVDADLKTAETTGPVLTAPPAGEKVVPIEELFPDEFGKFDPGRIEQVFYTP